MIRIVITLALLALAATPLRAEDGDIRGVEINKVGMGWRISVTLSHEDTGWEHFVDAWQIEDASGKVIATRELLHPHVQEQPFTRSLSSVMMPDGIREIFVRAHCSVSGWSKSTYRVEMSPQM